MTHLLKRKQAAEYLNMSPDAFDERVRPNVPKVPTGGKNKYMYLKEDLDRWVRLRRVGSSDETTEVESGTPVSGTIRSVTKSPQEKEMLRRLQKQQQRFTQRQSRGGKSAA